MNDLLWWFGQNTLATLLMVPCVLMACRLFRDRPAVQHLLWLVVLVKFMTPPIVTWPWRLEELQDFVQADDHNLPLAKPGHFPETSNSGVAEHQGNGNERSAVSGELVPHLERTASGVVDVDAAPPALGAPQTKRTMRWSMIVMNVLFSVWLAGAVTVLVSQWRRIMRCARVIRGCRDAPSHLTHEVADVASLLRINAPACLIAHGVNSPFLWCIGAARLVWPVAMTAKLDVSRSRGIIAHELAHLRRRDHWLTWLELAASILWWWNPMFWFVRRRLRETAEMSCDALAIAVDPDCRHDYADLLLQLTSPAKDAFSTPQLAMSAGNIASFERRLLMILSPTVSSKLSLRGLMTITVLAAVALPQWSTAQSAATTTDAPPSDGTKANEVASMKEVVVNGIRYLHPPAIAQSLPVAKNAWGPAVDGLRAAFLMSDVAGRGEDSMFVNGVLVVQNVSDRPIWFSETASLSSPIIHDASGAKIPYEPDSVTAWSKVGDQVHRSVSIARRTILAPGEQCVLNRECETAVYRTEREGRGVPAISARSMSVVVPPGRYTASVVFRPGLHSEREWDEIKRRSEANLGRLDSLGDSQGIAFPDFYEGIQVVSRSVPGEWTGSLETGKVDFAAFDGGAGTMINESRKVAADVNDSLRTGSRDGRLTLFKRGGTVRLYDERAHDALLAFVPAKDGRFVMEGASSARSLCLRTLIETSDNQVKMFDLCSGDLIAFLQPNSTGELELAPFNRNVRREPQYRSKTPLYCLLVFGKEKPERRWLVLDITDGEDGNVAYLDRTGDGDLTRPDNRVVGSLKKEHAFVTFQRDPLVHHFPQFKFGDIVLADGTRHTKFMLEARNCRQYQQDIAFRLMLRDQHDQLVSYAPGWGLLEFGDSPQTAPIVHLDGPLTLRANFSDGALFTPSCPHPPGTPEAKAWHAEHPRSFGKKTLIPGTSFMVEAELGTYGVGRGTFAKLFCGAPPDEVHPQAEITLPGGKVLKAALRKRCCTTIFREEILIPDDAPPGEATIKLSYPDWPAGAVAPSMDVIEVQGISKPLGT